MLWMTEAGRLRPQEISKERLKVSQSLDGGCVISLLSVCGAVPIMAVPLAENTCQTPRTPLQRAYHTL